MANQDDKKSSLLNYIENFIKKRGDETSPLTIDRNSIIIKTSSERDLQHINLVS